MCDQDEGHDSPYYNSCSVNANAYEAIRHHGVLRVHRPETEWLSTGWNGGRSESSCAYNVSVPTGWKCDSIDAYVRERLERTNFDHDGPILLTGVDLEHVRGARCGPVTAFATAGISNPAALPMDPPGGKLPDGRLEGSSLHTGTGTDRESMDEAEVRESEDGTNSESKFSQRVGTVNLIVGTTVRLEPGALANLVAITAEAKSATLLAETGFPGTTTDAIVVGHDPSGRTVPYSGSATPVGAAARACVREALQASIRSRYADSDATIPDSVADAEYGVSTDVRATVCRPTAVSESDESSENAGGV